MSDSLEQDAPWSWWMLCLACSALMSLCMFSYGMLNGALGGKGLDQNDVKLFAISISLLGLETLAFTRSSLLLNSLAFCALLIVCTIIWVVMDGWLVGRGLANGQSVRVTAVAVLGIFAIALTRWSLSTYMLAFCARLIVCMLVSGVLVHWLGGSRLTQGRNIGVTTVVTLGLVSLLFARQSLFLDMLAVYDLIHVCAMPSISLVFYLGGGGANVDLYVGSTIATMMGLVALAFALPSLFLNTLAFCALPAMSVYASAWVTETLGLGFPMIDKHICVVTVVVWSLRALLTPIQSIFDNILSVGAVLVLSTFSSGVIVSAPGVLDAEVAPRLYCASALALSGVFGALFMYQSYKICGGILVLVATLVPRATSTLRIVQVNRALETPETKFVKLLKQLAAPKRAWPMRTALLVLAYSTGGLSKLVQIPYDIAVGNQRRLLQVEVGRIRFRLADAYYCAGRDHVPGALRAPDDLLMSRGDWKSAKTIILTKVKDATKRLQNETRNQTQFVHRYLFQKEFTESELHTPIEAYEANFPRVEIVPEPSAIDVWAEVVFECLLDINFTKVW